MRQRILLLSIILLPSILCSCLFKTNSTKGDGNVISKEIAIKDYNQLDIEVNDIVLVYKQSTEVPYLKIETDRNIMDLLTIEQEEEEITIKVSPKHPQIAPTHLTITTNSTKLKELAIAGNGSCNLGKGITGEELEIILAGKCTVQADSITVNELDCAIAGNSQIKAFGLQTDILECNIAGRSQIEITVNNLISAEIAGKADILYKGNPQIKQQSIGKGSIKQVK